MYASRTTDLINRSTDRLPDIIPTVLHGPLFWVNSGKANIYGAEISEKYMFTKENSMTLGYSYTESRDDATNKLLPLIPVHLATMGTDIKLLEKLSWNLNLDFTGPLKREPGDLRDDLTPTIVANTTLRYGSIRNWDFYLSVYNLTNTKIYTPTEIGFAPASDLLNPGTEFLVGATYKFSSL